MRALLPIFASVLVAELGDKTQIATLLIATDRKIAPMLVFLAVAAALMFSTAVTVALGEYAQRYLANVPLRLIAGLGFIAIGAWTVIQYCRAV